jgi:hypothetical protein
LSRSAAQTVHGFFHALAQNTAQDHAQVGISLQEIIKIGFGQRPNIGFNQGIGRIVMRPA